MKHRCLYYVFMDKGADFINTSIQTRVKPQKKFPRAGITLFLLAMPFVIFIFVFSYIPLLGWLYAFFDYKPGIPFEKSPFVGLYYFKLMFSGGGELLRVLRNTLAMSFLGLLFSPLSAILAICLNEVKSKPFKKIVQTTTTLPNFVSWVIIFSLTFSLLSNEGLLNQLLISAHIIQSPVNILGNNDAVWFFQTGLGIWKGLGWSSIIYLAAISGIDGELYDAAKVDGANRLQAILNVTVPCILPTFLVLFLLSISSFLSIGFDQYLLFYNSLVADKIENIDYYVYRLGIVTSDYSYGTAVGIFKSIVSLILLFGANYLSKRIRGNSII